MPNWCYTNIIFHGDKTEIEDFRSKVDEWTSKILRPSDFKEAWLGNILEGAGLGDRIDSTENGLRCRGWINYIGEIEYGEDDACFLVDTETAWAPMMKMWAEVIKTLGYKTIGFSYQSEEPGMALYETYDPYGDFPEQWYVDIFIEGEDLNDKKLMELYDDRWYSTESGLKIALQTLLDSEEDDLKTLIDKAEKYPFKNEYSFIVVHQYEIVDEVY